MDKAALMSSEKKHPMDPTNQTSQAPDQGKNKSRGDAWSARAQPMRLARAVLSASRHVCTFFHSHEEEYHVLLPFIQEGFVRGEKAFHIVDPARRDAHPQRLAAAGIDTATGQQRGLLEVCAWTAAHLRDGYFDQDRMRALLEEVVRGGRQQGFPRTRFVTHMKWALEARASMPTLLETRQRRALGCCVTVTRLSAPTISPSLAEGLSLTSCEPIR